MIQKWKYIFLFLLNLQLVFSATIYVKHDATGANNGSSWSNAYTSFQSALNIATSGDQIWVARGTYKPSSHYGIGSTNRDYHFRMIDGVAIYGGFAGTETATSQRTSYGEGETNETILSGDLNGDDIGHDNNIENCYHVIYVPSGITLTNTSTLNDITLQGGSAGYIGGKGGIIYLAQDNKTIKLTNVVIKYGSAYDSGAGIQLENASIILENCIIHDVVSTTAGGIFANGSSNISIKNTKFYNCYAHNGDGGAIYASVSTVNIYNCLFYDNFAHASGGVFVNVFSTISINNCTFANNKSSNCNVLYSNNGTSTFNNSILYFNNKNTFNFNSYRVFDLTNNSNVTLNYSCYEDTPPFITKDAGSNINYSNNNITSDPLFVDAANDDYRITANSPCLDAGNNSYSSETYDIRGSSYNRFLNKSTGQNGTIDIGVYEFKAGYDGLGVTLSVSNIGTNSLYAASTVKSDAVPAVSSKGFVWSTSTNPTIALATKTTDGTGGGTHQNTITNLAEGTTYYIRAYATNSAGTVYSDALVIKTKYSILNDGNQDGILDSQQDHVHTFQDISGTKTITLVDLNNKLISEISSSISSESNFYYPFGLMNFKIHASQTELKIYFHGTSNLTSYIYRKLYSDNKYRQYDYAVFGSEVIGGNTVATVTLTLVDGGIGDSDGIVNGVITDPGGPAIAIVNTNIPTLSEWARIFLISFLVVFGVWKIRKYV